MAIVLELPTRDQIYKIYGGSAGFTKIIQLTGLVGEDLTPVKMLEVFSDLDRRKAIVSVLLDEGEFEPDPDLSTERKKEAFVLKVAKQIDNGWIIRLVARLMTEINDATGELKAITPAIAPQPELTFDELSARVDAAGVDPEQPSLQEISEVVKEVRQAHKAELPLAAIAHSLISIDGEIFTQSNITEGE